MRPVKTITSQQALDRLEALCARSEHCSSELLARLRRWKISDADSHAILTHLRDNRFLDDTRYAHAAVRQRHLGSRYGRRRIIQYLYQKQLPRDIIDEAIATEIDPDEYVRVLDDVVVSHLRREKETTSWESRNRVFRRVVSRGFEPDLVIAALKRQLHRLELDSDSNTDQNG